MAATGFDKRTEGPWPLGMYRPPTGEEFDPGSGNFLPSEQAPDGSAHDLQNLLVGGDGLPLRRGGTSYAASAALGAAGLMFVVAAQLKVGDRVLFGNTTSAAALDSTTFPASSTSLTTAGVTPGRAKPVGATALAGAMFIDGDAVNGSYFWGGGRKASYSTGTVSFTFSGSTITGVGTSWLANVEPGMLFHTTAGGTQVILSVDSNTQLTVLGALPATAAGVAYTISPFYPAGLSGFSATSGGRLFICPFEFPTRVFFTPVRSTFFTPGANDYIEFPTQVLGIAALRDTLMVFTYGGVYQVSGVALNLTDPQGNPQWRTELVSDKVLWDKNGIVTWNQRLIVPCIDGIYLMDGVSAPVPISQRIDGLYLGHVRTNGRLTGRASSFENHYLLPVLDSSLVPQEVLVCSLTGGEFAWSRFTTGTVGGSIRAFATTGGATPALLAASNNATSKLLRANYFTQQKRNTASTQDADGTSIPAVYESRTLSTGENGVANFLGKIRVPYTLASNVPLTGGATLAMALVNALTGATQSVTTKGEDEGDTPMVGRPGVRWGKFRLKLTMATTAATVFSLKPFDYFTRRSGSS